MPFDLPEGGGGTITNKTNIITKIPDGLKSLRDGSAITYGGIGNVNTIGGAANAITLTTGAFPFTAYVNGHTVNVLPTSTNTGAFTSALDGLVAKAWVKRQGAVLVALGAGDVVANIEIKGTFSTQNDTYILSVNPSAALLTVAQEFTQRQTLSLTQDVDLSGITGALIVGGDGTGPHIAIDANEIVAKSNATTGAVLALNNNGDITMGGTSRLIQGIIPFSRTAEFFIASFTSIANGAESEVILGHGLATDNVHFTLMTNQPQVSGYSLSITRPDGFAHTYSNGAVPSPGVTSASSATVTVRLKNNTGGSLTIGFKIAIIGE